LRNLVRESMVIVGRYHIISLLTDQRYHNHIGPGSFMMGPTYEIVEYNPNWNRYPTLSMWQ